MTNNQSPPHKEIKECGDYPTCKGAAVNRLRDAIILFSGKRYTGALYMAGYIIEIGTKAEFHRLANERVSPSVCDKIVLIIKEHSDYKESNSDKEKSSDHGKEKEWIGIKNTVGNYYNNYAVQRYTPYKGKKSNTSNTLMGFLERLKADPTLENFLNQPVYQVIFGKRYTADKVREDTNMKLADESTKKPKLHNLEDFVGYLKKWKGVFGESIDSTYDDFKFYWSTNLRYSDEKIQEEDARKAIMNSIDFLCANKLLTEKQTRKFKEILAECKKTQEPTSNDGKLVSIEEPEPKKSNEVNKNV
jgi:hypothetical protein